VSKRVLLGIACLFLQASAALSDPPPTVYLELFPLTGEVRLENRAATPFNFIFYSIDSTNSALDPSKWTSIADNYDASGNGFIDPTHEWSKFPATSSELAEGVVPGTGGTLLPFRSIGLGRIWIPNTMPVDFLSVQVKLPDGSDATVTKTLAIDGDYLPNLTVDQQDLTAWSILYGNTNTTLADGNHNGVIDAADYVVWRQNLGAHYVGMSLGQASGGGLAAAAVPEPSSMTLALLASCGFGWAVRVRRRRVVQ
jgi:PEP-CTERM motif